MQTKMPNRANDVANDFIRDLARNGYYVIEQPNPKRNSNTAQGQILSDILETNMAVYPPMLTLNSSEAAEAMVIVRDWVLGNLEMNADVRSMDENGVKVDVTVAILGPSMGDLLNIIILGGSKDKPFGTFTPMEQLTVKDFAFNCYERTGDKAVPIYADCVEHRFRAVYRLGRAKSC